MHQPQIESDKNEDKCLGFNNLDNANFENAFNIGPARYTIIEVGESYIKIKVPDEYGNNDRCDTEQNCKQAILKILSSHFPLIERELPNIKLKMYVLSCLHTCRSLS